MASSSIVHCIMIARCKTKTHKSKWKLSFNVFFKSFSRVFHTGKIYTGLQWGHLNVLVSCFPPASSEPRKSQWSIYNGDEREEQNKEWLMMNISILKLEMTGLPYLCCRASAMCFCLVWFGFTCNDRITASQHYTKLKTAKSDFKVLS